jgi:hypothetical protein
VISSDTVLGIPIEAIADFRQDIESRKQVDFLEHYVKERREVLELRGRVRLLEAKCFAAESLVAELQNKATP